MRLVFCSFVATSPALSWQAWIDLSRSATSEGVPLMIENRIHAAPAMLRYKWGSPWAEPAQLLTVVRLQGVGGIGSAKGISDVGGICAMPPPV